MLVSQCLNHASTVSLLTAVIVPVSRLISSSRIFRTTSALVLPDRCLRSRSPLVRTPTVIQPCQRPSLARKMLASPGEPFEPM